MTATILQFPVRNKGRIRKSTGANAEGLFAMHQLNANGENIEVFNLHRSVERTDVLGYILTALLNSSPKEIRDAVYLRAQADATLGHSDNARIFGALLADSYKGRA